MNQRQDSRWYVARVNIVRLKPVKVSGSKRILKRWLANP